MPVEEHTFTITVTINPSWIEYLTKYPDIFDSNAAGYWLRGAEHDPELGWLCWEDDEKCAHGEEPNRVEAYEAWKARLDPLPHGWFRLDRAAAIRAWEEGVKRWGVDWYEKADSTSQDVVVQLALLGEVRYG